MTSGESCYLLGVKGVKNVGKGSSVYSMDNTACACWWQRLNELNYINYLILY